MALALVSDEGTAVSHHVVGLAFLSTLQLLAAKQPLLVAVDDAQWLDPPSAVALQFAARRLEATGTRLLVATRREDNKQPLQLERDLAQNMVRVDVGPLSLGALHRLVLSRLGEPLSRPTLRKVHETSGGNPFYALEIARFLLERTSTLGPAEPLPVPSTLEELVRARIDRQPQIVKLGARGGSPPRRADAGRARRGVRAGPEENTLDWAVAVGVLELERGRVRFTHPLLAAAVVSGIGPQRRRRVHAQLAQLVTDLEERARHLALATEGADQQLPSRSNRQPGMPHFEALRP